MIPSPEHISVAALDTPEGNRRVAQACAQHGFFYLTDHGLNTQLPQFIDAMMGIFDLPLEDKRALTRTEENPWGYFDRELTKNRRDWKEIFDCGIDTGNSVSQWPTRSDFKPQIMAWFGAAEGICQLLLEAICRSLELNTNILSGCFSHGHTSFLRLNHYPPCPEPQTSLSEGHLGISHHTDAGAVTLLLQADVAGLQFLVDESWYTVPPDGDALLVNVGDLVQVWSNDQYKAPIHRVLANKSEHRYSAAFFYNPSFNTTVEPLVGALPRYSPFTWQEFRSARATGDYADTGSEAQISDYRVAS